MRDKETEWACLMRAAGAGDSVAYKRLLSALTPFLRALARKAFVQAGLGTGDVEDVVQETLLAIHLKRQTWDAEQRFLPWVRAITRNKFIDNLRRRGGRSEVPIDEFVENIAAEEPQSQLSPHETDRLLAKLGGRQQEVVKAICIEGTSIREVAAKFRISEGATRVALHRGLAALSAAFRSEGS